MEQVILVDEQDNSIGTMEKLEAHQRGVLHRAFSILVFNSKGDMLLQRRARTKYHSGGLWTNACCSHPAPGESITEATRRRLKHEMGLEVESEYAYKFIYRASLDHGLTEHELDHVFVAVTDDAPNINIEEVDEWKYIDIPSLLEDMNNQPEQYTHWFKLIMDRELARRQPT